MTKADDKLEVHRFALCVFLHHAGEKRTELLSTPHRYACETMACCKLWRNNYVECWLRTGPAWGVVKFEVRYLRVAQTTGSGWQQ